MRTIASVRAQTHTNMEIIVVNDGSDQREYYEHDWTGIKVVHLEKNSKELFGYGCIAYTRNQGLAISEGSYIAFCDDDIWFPKKIELQLKAMKETGCKMSSTDGLIGKGPYNPMEMYKKYNAEHYYKTLQKIYRGKGSDALDQGFPKIWTLEFLQIHNCVVTSSLVVDTNLLKDIEGMKNLNTAEDYDCWLRALRYTNLVYVDDICFYYDSAHGDGRNY